MNGRVTATIFYYCFAISIVYLIVLVFFDTAESLYSNEFRNTSNSVSYQKLLNDSSNILNVTLVTLVANVTNVTAKPLLPCEAMARVALRNLLTSKLFESFYRCTYPLWSRFVGLPDQMLMNWPYMAYVCDEEDELLKIPLVPYPTKNKTYWGIVPQCEDTHVLVTLGIRNDSLAVRKMKEQWGNLVTFGTSAIGSSSPEYDHFYNYAIGVNGTGLETIYNKNGSIVELRQKSVKSFFKYSIRVERIDMLWINVEAREFEYWKFFSSSGEDRFAGLGVAVCQINIEFNRNDSVNFEKLLHAIYKTREFIYLRTSVTQNERITRAFFVNIFDRICVRKYLK